MLLAPGARFVRPAPSPENEDAQRVARKQWARDWADLCRYRRADATLKRRPRLVLMGDSITDFWREGDPALFAGGLIADRGISGQTSSQMLVRFWPDVIALHPRAVQILAGTNDIAGNTGPTTEEDFEDNIKAMVELAQAHHIRVLLGSIPPAASFWWAPAYRPARQIRRLNDWLRRYARANDLAFVDYYAHLATPAGAFRPDLSNDGVHPNDAGYKVMTGLLKTFLLTRGEGQRPRGGP
jgi:lysophospholipase L1-like esterase